MADTEISWADKVWNPTRGCRRVSPGCKHCYAETIAARFSDEGQAYHGLALRKPARWTGKGRFVADKLDEPLRWRKPARIFVDSMSDLFFEAFSFEEIAAVFGVMAATPRHSFQVLTKRPERAAEFFEWLAAKGCEEIPPLGWNRAHVQALRCAADVLPLRLLDDPAFNYADKEGWPWPLPNVWLGVSVEDQVTADARIPVLLRCPAALHFVSYEPALGPVDFSPWLGGTDAHDAERGPSLSLGWIIVGGESGPGARSFDLAWARRTRDQCRAAGVPLFFKQGGSRPMLDGVPYSIRDRGGKDLSEFPIDIQIQEFPHA